MFSRHSLAPLYIQSLLLQGINKNFKYFILLCIFICKVNTSERFYVWVDLWKVRNYPFQTCKHSSVKLGWSLKMILFKMVSSVQSLSCVQLFLTPWTAACQASLSMTNSRSPHKPMSIESVMPSNHFILCFPLLLLPSIFPSIKVFSNESALRMKWPKYWSFSFSISPSNEHPGLISPRMDSLGLLSIQGTLKSLLQHQSSKASILLCSAFLIVQLSHPYMTTGKTIALTRRSFVDYQFSSVQSLSRVRLFATPCITAHQASLSIINSQSLLKLMPIEWVMPSSHLILCRPLLLLPPILPSSRGVSNE